MIVRLLLELGDYGWGVRVICGGDLPDEPVVTSLVALEAAIFFAR